MADLHKNFVYGTVSVAPSPATTGTTFSVTNAIAADFPIPTTPYNVTVWPTATQPSNANAEIWRITAKGAADSGGAGHTQFTITRIQESTSARSSIVGDQIAATITVKTLTDVEGKFPIVTADITDANVTSRKMKLDQIQNVKVGASVTTSSTTNVDLTGVTITFTPSVACNLLIHFNVSYYNATGSQVAYYIQLDGVTICPTVPDDYGSLEIAAALRGTVHYSTWKTGVSAVSHTVKVIWRVTAGTGYSYNNELTVIPFAS